MMQLFTLVFCLLIFCAASTIISTDTHGTKYVPGVGGTSSSTNHPNNMQKSLTTQWGFDENQCVTLTQAITTDQGSIPAGTQVSSHFIYYNTITLQSSTARLNANWTFDGDIIGTMRDSGSKIIASNPQLGLTTVDYITAPLSNYGVEEGGSISFTGAFLTFNAVVTDWVDAFRVVTRCNLCNFNNVVCTASDQCHNVGTCDPLTGNCSNPVKDDGTSCNDAQGCTLNDSCQSGVCQGTPKVCTAPQCRVPGTCDLATGECPTPTNAAENTPCNDNNGCTINDKCHNGVCGGTNKCNCKVGNKCGMCRTDFLGLDDVFQLLGIPGDHACDNTLLSRDCGLILGLFGDCCYPANQTGLYC